MILFPGLPPSRASPVSPATFPSGQRLRRLMLPHPPSQKPFPAVSVPGSLPPPELVRLESPPSLSSTEEAKLFIGCSGSWLPWGCQMYLAVIGILLPWLCDCCAW